MAKTSRYLTPWIVAGGKISETAHCERCGRGLEIGAQPLPIAVAAMKAFIGIHKSCRAGSYTEPQSKTPQDWLKSRDIGISSCTICAVLTKTNSPMSEYNVPHDPSDFGRCYRLLELFPAWKSRLSEVADRFPEWAPFCREWNKLTEMYEVALAANSGEKMYEFMKELEYEGGTRQRPAK